MNLFDIKKFTMRREVVKRFLETGPSKQTTNIEKTNFLRCLLNIRGTEHMKPHVSLSLHSHGEHRFLIYNYGLVVNTIPAQ